MSEFMTYENADEIFDEVKDYIDDHDTYEEIPYSTWSTYTPAQKAEHPNAIITDAPGGSGGSSTNFIGTRAEWNALSSAEQNAYDTVDITDEDTNDGYVYLSYGRISGSLNSNGQLVNGYTVDVPYSASDFAVASVNISYWSTGVLYSAYGSLTTSNNVNTLKIHFNGKANDSFSSVRVEVLLVKR